MICDDLVRYTTSSLVCDGFEPLPVKESHAACSGVREAGIHSIAYRSAAGTEARGAWVTAPRVEILNLMIYPRDASRVPVFASELIFFGGKPFVGVVDLQPAAGTSHPLIAEVVNVVGPAWQMLSPGLSPGGLLPAWAHTHFTPVCIYTRPVSTEETPRLKAAFHTYLALWLAHFASREQGMVCGGEALEAYQAHHVTHTPGRLYLARTFGEAWTESYLREFMYAPLPGTGIPAGVP